MKESARKKILVVALDNLGDAIMASSVFPVLRSFYPQAELGFWVKRYCADVFLDSPLIDHLHTADPFWDKSPGRGKGGLGTFLWVWREVRNMHYDAALILNAEWRRAAFCFGARIPERVGFGRRKSHYFLSEVFRPITPEPHVVEEHRALLEFWLKTSISPALCQPSMSVSPQLHRWVKEWRSENNLTGRPLVFVHPFTGDPRRTWPIEKYVEALEALQKRVPDLGFAISCDGRDEELVEEAFSKKPHLKIAKVGPLRDMKAIISQCRLYLGANTGPSHLAAALGTPVVCLFGSWDPGRYRPRGPGTIKLIAHSPIAELPVEEVVRSAAELLERPE